MSRQDKSQLRTATKRRDARANRRTTRRSLHTRDQSTGEETGRSGLGAHTPHFIEEDRTPTRAFVTIGDLLNARLEVRKEG